MGDDLWYSAMRSPSLPLLRAHIRERNRGSQLPVHGTVVSGVALLLSHGERGTVGLGVRGVFNFPSMER